MFKLLCSLFIVLLITSCSSKEKEDLVNEVPKDGSIETSVKVTHLNDSFDLLITRHAVYTSPVITQIITKTDTIPALGKTTIKDEKKEDKLIQKDYNIFITVK